MKEKTLRLKIALRAVMLILMLCGIGITKGYAYDFSAVCSTGQILYYDITDATNHYVALTYPGSSSNNPWSGFTKPTGVITLPETVEYNSIQYSVTSISNYAFMFCNGLTSLTTGNSIESIGNYAFYNCYGLTVLNLGNSVTNIGNNAFYYCKELMSLTMPNSVESIGDCAFYDCRGLASLTIGNSVTIIGTEAFSNCKALTSLTIPNSVTIIGYGAFNGCSGLASLTIPNSVTSIGGSAFSFCSGLTSVNYIGDIAQWCNITFESSGSNPLEYAHNLYINNMLVTNLFIPETVTEVKKYAFSGCSVLTSITIPNSVTSIGYSAFSGCSGLTSLTIPNSVTNITDFAFSGCSGITSLIIPNSLTSIAGHAFSDCSGLTLLTIPNSVTSIGYCAFYGCSGLTSLIIPNSVTNIAGNAFYNCSGLMSLIIGNSVESIGDYAFRGCSGLTSVTIPNSVTSIGSDAFYYCSGITTVYWNAVNMISYPSSAYNTNGAFRYCYNLTEVVFGDSVLTIPSYAFYDCSGLTSLTIGNSVDIIGDYAFSRCSGLTSLTIPTSVTSIGNSAFYGCSGLSSVNYTGDIAQWCSVTFGNASSNPLYYAHNLQINNTLVTALSIPETVTEVKQYAFYSCSGLTSLTIGNSVTSIAGHAFHGCSGLTSLIIGNSVESIGDYAFFNCTGLASLIIPNSVEDIGNSAFSECSGLASLTIGNSVASINTYAFSGCSGLISIIIGNSVVNIGDYAFYNCNGLASLIIPNSVTNIGWAAFSGCSELTSLTIGNSVGSVAGHAFSGCGGLTSINILAVTPPTINTYTFSNVNKSIPVYVPYCSLTAYQAASEWSAFTNYHSMAYLTISGYGSSTSSDHWAFIASPVTSDVDPATIDGLIAETATEYDLYQLNPATTNEWENWKQTGDHYHFDLVNGRGYLYANKNDVNLILQGDMFTGDYKDVTLQTGWNLVGNPYAQSAYINRSYYKMNAAGDDVEAVSAYTTTAIPVCTGVVVQGASNSDVVRFTISKPSKSAGNGSLQMTLTKAGNRGNEMQDKAIVIFEENVQLGKYIFNENHAKLYIPQNGNDYAIAYSDGQHAIPLYFRTKEMGTYTINFNNDAELKNVYLVDKFEGAVIDLSVCSSYTFIGSSADRPDRFELVFGSPTGSETDSFAYQSGNEIIVNGNGELQVFDIMGRVIAEQHINGVETIAKPSQNGVYIFRLNEKNQKIVVR